MDINVIKKELYKQNPIAKIDYISEGKIYYKTIIKIDSIQESLPHDLLYLFFCIPMEETKGTRFNSEEPAKLLIRWLVFWEKDI